MAIVGIGTDIVECLRIANMIERHGELFLKRVFTSSEIEYCSSRKSATQHYAGRWAAKEAVLKTLGTGLSGGITFLDMEIRNDDAGRPVLALGGVAREVFEQLGARRVMISISHCRSFATAIAIAEDED